ELGNPLLALRRECDARGEQSVARKNGRLLQRELCGGTAALHVPPHVSPLDRIDIEGRAVPALLLEDGAEQEWSMAYARAVRHDGKRGEVGVRTSEIEPELDRRASHPVSLV